MAELKTLKDLKKEIIDEGWTMEDSIVSADDLRQEAIKWIKEIRSEQVIATEEEKNEITINGVTLFFDQWSGVSVMLKHFFNISKEDLK